MKASLSLPSTAVRLGALPEIEVRNEKPSRSAVLGSERLAFISGRAPSGYAVCSSSITTSRDSGRNSAITCTAIRGENNDMLATDRPVVGPKRLRWQTAEVREVIAETPRVKSLVLHVADWPGHLPGQHVDIRLTGEGGYQAQRSYSIASPPEVPDLMLTVERIDEGEVSPYLAKRTAAG